MQQQHSLGGLNKLQSYTKLDESQKAVPNASNSKLEKRAEMQRELWRDRPRPMLNILPRPLSPKIQRPMRRAKRGFAILVILLMN